ncbi:hypothetical protein K469DRAFT_658334 [Zopfia rhizophila CBS 207.26]|uniref:Box C/D snoRNA protein 1 n=1 Tax=Zopfia rhizophila CBS 207.26 TaxID=1314779 RepID=A0A6A6EF56_9PEZI|nr:hypothetical protein K469DRAFT_658334 [Zopfia rhizophila CBS 207.26]
MPNETLLSDLCSICNNNKSKYRCPGCAARTCSLPCYKRHQQWVQCTGKRDPTKYVKKSQLATPAGVDHDFNFITSIERGLDRAERDVNARGLAATNEVRTRPRKGQVTDRHFEAVGVKVIRAPKGLSRQKENTTHRNSKGNIWWTIEWIHQDKTRTVSETSSKSAVALAYDSIIGEDKLTKKRKRTHRNDSPSAQGRGTQYASASLSNEVACTSIEEEDEEGKSTSARRTSPAAEPISKPPSQAAANSHGAEMADPSHPSPHSAGANSQSIPSRHHFYLLRPQANSSRRVLIPISSSTTLHECLRGRTVLEFPTIYALLSPPERLPEDFMLESEYLVQEREDRKELDQLLRTIDPKEPKYLKVEKEDENAAEEVDSQNILEMLERDLSGKV